MSTIRVNLLVALGLFGFEVLLGAGLIGVSGLLIAFLALIVFLFDKRNSPNALRIAAIYAGVGIATIGFIQFNWHVAQQRAVPVIAACTEFRAKYHRYPQRLNDVVPEFLSSMPSARYTILGRHFGYEPDRPLLFFSVMFHGVASYDFQTHTWITNE